MKSSIASPETVVEAGSRPGTGPTVGRSTAGRGKVSFLREQVPLLALVVIYLVAGKVLSALLGIPLQSRPVWVAGPSGALLALILLVGIFAGGITIWGLTSLAAWLPARLGRPTPLADRASKLLSLSASPERALRLVVVFALLGVFMNTFVGFKRAIPQVQPFAWDIDFMRLDLLLHAGRHPWEWLHPLLSRPALTDALDVLYYLWFPVHVLGLTAIVWGADLVSRTRFLVGFCLVWMVLGTVLATAFSSAGPCYFGLVTGTADPYEPLMAYLHGVDRTHGLIAIGIQQILWQGHVHGTTHALIEGISAMPSLHIALPVLYALATRRDHRAVSIGFWVFTAFMLVGSVHLGWHYAVDGYLSLLVVPFVWWISCRLVPDLTAGAAA